jgi:replicative DNA helicase
MRSLSEAVMDIAQLPIRWCDEATNLHDICAEATREHAKDPLGALVIDLLQKISVPNERVRERQIAIASETLKSLAKRLDIPVVIACHVNRGKEDAPDKRPELSDLRESGAIEGDADIVIFIYRDEYYNRGHDNPERGIAELIVAKHRDGPTDTIPVAYAKESTQFHDLADHEISAWRERKLARESGGTGRRRRPAAAPVQSPRFSVDPDDLPPEN